MPVLVAVAVAVSGKVVDVAVADAVTETTAVVVGVTVFDANVGVWVTGCVLTVWVAVLVGCGTVRLGVAVLLGVRVLV